MYKDLCIHLGGDLHRPSHKYTPLENQTIFSTTDLHITMTNPRISDIYFHHDRLVLAQNPSNSAAIANTRCRRRSAPLHWILISINKLPAVACCSGSRDRSRRSKARSPHDDLEPRASRRSDAAEAAARPALAARRCHQGIKERTPHQVIGCGLIGPKQLDRIIMRPTFTRGGRRSGRFAVHVT
jgi:hypothetical protein